MGDDRDYAETEHADFLERVSSTTANLAATAWRLVREASGGRMRVPDAAAGPDGEMFYSWDDRRHHLELEIISGQPSEWFYRDRETGDFWGEDWSLGEPLPEKAVVALELFCDREEY